MKKDDRNKLEKLSTTVRVCKGDIVVGDADDVVAVPVEFEDKVLKIAFQIEETEEKIRAAVGLGMRLDEARKQNNYHSLQTKYEGE